MNFFEKVYEVVKTIPYGKVASYGMIARKIGNPKMSRQVGFALHVNPNPNNIHCYRVVNKEGKVSNSFAFGGGNRQRQLLENEGIIFDKNHCVLKEFFVEYL